MTELDGEYLQDQALVRAVLASEPGAFERLVRRFQNLCWHIVLRMVRNPEDARELCQETFLRVHQCLHQYRSESALKSWIGQVAYSIAKRHLERKRIPISESHDGEEGDRLVESVADAVDLEHEHGEEQAMRSLHYAIDGLPPLQRTLITLFHLDELTISEISSITGLADGTIKSHLYRTRKQLRQVLAPQLGAVA
jgi:RNA polymerase sigma-70 factor (ECF subfamily)